MSKATECELCSPDAVLLENALAYVRLDSNSLSRGHVLVVPKQHIASLSDLAAEDDRIVGEVVRRAAAIAHERGIATAGYRTVFNTNRDAGQTVFHVHLHLLGGRSMNWPPG